MTISDELMADWTSPNCNEVLVSLLEISHPLWSSPFRLVNHNEDVVHDGDTYSAWSFKLNLPSEAQGALPRDAAVIDNVTSDLAAALKQQVGSRTKPTVTRRVVTVGNPDYVERGPTVYQVRRFKVTYSDVTLDLTLNGVEYDALPKKKIDPTNFPGAFGRILSA